MLFFYENLFPCTPRIRIITCACARVCVCLCVLRSFNTRTDIQVFFFIFIYRSKHIETAWRVPVAYKIIILYARKAAKSANRIFFTPKKPHENYYFCFQGN